MEMMMNSIIEGKKYTPNHNTKGDMMEIKKRTRFEKELIAKMKEFIKANQKKAYLNSHGNKISYVSKEVYAIYAILRGKDCGDQFDSPEKMIEVIDTIRNSARSNDFMKESVIRLMAYLSNEEYREDGLVRQEVYLYPLYLALFEYRIKEEKWADTINPHHSLRSNMISLSNRMERILMSNTSKNHIIYTTQRSK